MNSRERLLTAIAREEPDRVPVSPNMVLWAAEQYGDYGWKRQLEVANEFGMDAIVDVQFDVPSYLRDPRGGDYRDLEGVTADVAVEERGEMGVFRRRFRTPAGELTDTIVAAHSHSTYGLSPTPVTQEPLVKGPEDVEKLRWLLADPRKVPAPDWQGMVETIGERGLLRVHPAPGAGPTMITTAMGMENAMVAFYEDRETFDRLLEMLSDWFQNVTKRMLELGAPYVFVSWHDLGVSAGWSPAIWREAFKPRIEANIDLVHECGARYHFFDNGPIMPIIPDLAELGPDTVSSLCPPPAGDVELAEAKRIMGDKVCLVGNVDAIHVMQEGGPDGVREAVHEAIQAAAPGGGFILGNSDTFFPGTPRENVEAFFEAAREFGGYPVGSC